MGGELQFLDEGRETTFVSSYREVRKNEKSGFHCMEFLVGINEPTIYSGMLLGNDTFN